MGAFGMPEMSNDRQLPLVLSQGLRVLALGAHVDDVEIGCGATLLSLMAEFNAEVHVVTFCDHHAEPHEFSRKDEGELAAELAGYTSLTWFSFKDTEFPNSWREVQARITGLRREMSPSLVFAPHPSDNHQDHRVVAEASMREFRYGESVWHFEIPQFGVDHKFSPNIFYDTSHPTGWDHEGYLAFVVDGQDTYAHKKAFILQEAMVSQRGKPLLQTDYVLGAMRSRGLQAGRDVHYAEAFEGRTLVSA